MKSEINLTTFFIVFWLLQHSFGLHCKQGEFDALSGRISNSSLKNECEKDDLICYAFTCTAWDQPGTVRIYWGCTQTIWRAEEYCKDMEIVMAKSTKSDNVSCVCTSGGKGIDWATADVPLPLPSAKRLKCAGGFLDAQGYGQTVERHCYDGQSFCYVATCAKNEHVRIEWGCAKGMDCVAISAGVQKATDMTGISCECKFGEKDVEFGNQKFHFSPEAQTTKTTASSSTSRLTTHSTTPANVKIENTLQCLAWNICDLSEKWGRAKPSKRFAIRKKCEEMFANWAQMTKKISNEYEMNADNKNGQAFMADFIGAKGH